MLEQQGNEQPTDTAIAVEVRMDGLKLNMRQPDANQRRQPTFRMKILLKVRQERRQLLGWGGNEYGVARACPANPVLPAANFAWLLIGAADSAHQTTMSLIQQTNGDRQPASAPDLRSCIFNRVEVVADLMYVLDGSFGCLFRFVLEKVYECGLSTFNLRGDDCLFAHKGIDKPVERRHHFAGYLEAPKRMLRAGERRGKFSAHAQRRVTRRKRVRDKRCDGLARNSPRYCSASGAHVRSSRKAFFTKILR